MAFRHIYILGGHRLALGYFGRLGAGVTAGRLKAEGVFCVTGDAQAEASRALPPENVIRRDPHEFLCDYVADFTRAGESSALVPDHGARHVLLEAFLALGQRLYPEHDFRMKAFPVSLTTPVVRPSEDGSIVAASYADWLCPADCAEPEVCPHTGVCRGWSFRDAIARLMEGLPEEGASRHVFFCRTLLDEVSFIPLDEVCREARMFLRRLRGVGGAKPLEVTVATHSHCHAIIGNFEVAPRTAAAP